MFLAQDYVSRLSWSLVLQLDRLPQHGGEPSFLEHVIALIQRTMTHDSRLANIVGCLFNNSSLPPIAEAFKSTLFVSLSNTVRCVLCNILLFDSFSFHSSTLTGNFHCCTHSVASIISF